MIANRNSDTKLHGVHSKVNPTFTKLRHHNGIDSSHYRLICYNSYGSAKFFSETRNVQRDVENKKGTVNTSDRNNPLLH